MSDRSGDRGRGPKPGTPEYEWLYGSRGSAGTPGSSEPVDDATRVLPQTPAGQPSQPGRSGRATAAPVPAPAPPRRGFRFPRLRRGRLRWVKWLVVLWLVFLLAVPFWAWAKVGKVDAFPGGKRPDDQPGTTYLMVGSDARADLAGSRTDTIMLLHTGDGPNLLLSIPRDSMVDIPDHGRTKINAAFAYGGPKLLVRTIEQNTGIRIDHYVEIGFDGFKDVVDALGGITICPKVNMNDPLAHLDIKKGCQEADGKTALGYSRARHFDPQYGDISRAQHQREVVAAVGKAAFSPWTFLNPVRYWNFNLASARAVRVSEGTGVFRMGMFASAMTNVDGDDGLTCVVPLANLSIEWDADRARRMFAFIIADDTESIEAKRKTLCTPKGLLP